VHFVAGGLLADVNLRYGLHVDRKRNLDAAEIYDQWVRIREQ
jgi:hypothetical protein